MTTTPLLLSPDEVVPRRMFAHPDHVSSDRSTLCLLIRDVARRIAQSNEPVEVWEPSKEDWYRHVIIPRPDAFADHERLTVVGFFGRKRDLVSLEVARAIQDMSDLLEQRIPTFTGVLSYSTHLLVDELNYANLVLFDSPEAIDSWRHTEPHHAAAGSLSKDYYAFVRIYHGSIVTQDLTREGAVHLERVKYWDYRDNPTWTAQRELVA